MIVELKIANYRSIYEEQTFSLVASRDKKHPDSLIYCEGFHLLKTAAIFGANASGKSNLIKAVAFMAQLVRDSATKMNEGDEIEGATPFKLSAKSLTEPCSFEVVLIEAGSRYQYGFSVTTQSVCSESLYSFNAEGDQELWLDRQLDEATGEMHWTFGGPLLKYQELFKERTRSNSLALSTGPRENIECLKPIYGWFRNRLSVHDLSNSSEYMTPETANKCKRDDIFRKKVISFLKDADLRINDIEIRDSQTSSTELKSIFTYSAQSNRNKPNIFLKEGNGSGVKVRTRQVLTLHKMMDTEDFVFFELEEESSGVQNLFGLAGTIITALEEGSVVFLDECDSSLHPLFTHNLVEFFQSPTANTTKAQLIFATHDSSLLDPYLLRRDQIYFAEYNRMKGSEYFSLYDFNSKDRPRNSGAFQQNYLDGRIGAVPHFGRTFEEMEIR